MACRIRRWLRWAAVLAVLAGAPPGAVAQPAGEALNSSAHKALLQVDEAMRPPRRIAVLPASGDAPADHRDDVRMAIHNNLSSKAFDLMKLFEVDERVALLGRSEGLLVATASPETLARRLDVEGLVYVDVAPVSRLYAGPYAEQTVSVKLRFYSLPTKRFIWEKDAVETEREGGGGISVLSLLTSAVTSALVLTDNVRRTLIDRLGRSATAEIPAPAGSERRAPPPRIETALSNAAEGPFKAGDEIKVAMRAEPGLVATFDLGNRSRGIRIEEKSAGEYFGRYVVQEADNAEGLLVTVHAVRPKDRAEIDWRVPGNVSLDTTPPAAVANLRGQPGREGLRLSWDAPAAAGEKLRYLVEKADAEGRFRPLAETEVNEHVDASASAGSNNFYRVVAIDSARNRGPLSHVRVAHVSPGPTKVAGDITENTVWYAIGSPYVVEGAIRVLPSTTLTLEAGVVVQFAPQAGLEVLGRIHAAGRPDGVIQLHGDDWKLIVRSGGQTPNRIEHVRAGGANGGLVIDGGNVRIDHLTTSGLANAVTVDANGELEISRTRIDRSTTGLTIGNATVRASGVTVSACETGVSFGRQGFAAQHGLRFENNRLHARADGEVVLTDVVFDEKDYLAVQSKLRNVRVNWTALPDEHNLRSRWLDDSLKEIAGLLANRQADDAYAKADSVEARAEGALTAVHQALASVARRPTRPDTPLGQAAQALEGARPGSAALVLQEAAAPYRAGQSDATLVDHAKGRFAHGFLDAYFPKRLQTTGPWANKLPGLIKSSLVLMSRRQGAMQRYWVAHVVDLAAAEQELLLAGAIAKENDRLRIGVLVQGDGQEALQVLAALLDKHLFRHTALGQGPYGDPERQRARDLGINLVIELGQTTRVQNSSLSATLKQIEARLGVTLHDVLADRVLQKHTAQATVADFRTDSGTQRAVADAFERIASPVVKSLWSAAAALPPPPPALATSAVAPVSGETERKPGGAVGAGAPGRR